MKQTGPGVRISFKRDSDSDSRQKPGLQGTPTPTPNPRAGECWQITGDGGWTALASCLIYARPLRPDR